MEEEDFVHVSRLCACVFCAMFGAPSGCGWFGSSKESFALEDCLVGVFLSFFVDATPSHIPAALMCVCMCGVMKLSKMLLCKILSFSAAIDLLANSRWHQAFQQQSAERAARQVRGGPGIG